MANWEGINEFVAVVEAQNFTLAAKRLGLSTAQVSRQVAKLENRLSTKLLNRTTRVVAVKGTSWDEKHVFRANSPNDVK